MFVFKGPVYSGISLKQKTAVHVYHLVQMFHYDKQQISLQDDDDNMKLLFAVLSVDYQ